MRQILSRFLASLAGPPACLRLSVVVWLGLAPATFGCLPEPEEVQGLQLFSGRGIENVSVLGVEGKTHVFFEVRQLAPSPTQSGRTDLWIVPIDGSAPARRFFEGRLDGAQLISAGGDPPQYWVPVNEREETVGRRAVRVTDRLRVDVRGNVLERISGVAQLQLLGDGWKSYQRPVPNLGTLAYFIRDEMGTERRIDDLTGPIHFSGSGFYYVGGPSLTLYWVPSLTAPAEPLRSGVTRMRPPKDNLTILTVPENGRPVDVVFDVFRKTERKIPGRNICCWLDFKGNEIWRYAEARTAEAPARYHEYNVNSGAHEVFDLPADMADLIRIVGRPSSSDQLYFDSQGTLALYQPEPERVVNVLPLKVPAPRFSNDGRYLLYVNPTSLVPSPEGTLMIQDVAFSAPPRQLSPPGTTLFLNSFFTIEQPDPPIVVFWARFGRAASDLYFAPLDEPGLERVAEGIRDVSVTRSRLLGIVRTSLQDLVGDLVLKSLPEEKELVIGRSVDSFWVVEDSESETRNVLYTLRTRKAADLEGLWVTELPEL